MNAQGVMEVTGEMLRQVIRSLEGSVMLPAGMGSHLKEARAPDRAGAFFRRAGILEKPSRGGNPGQEPEI